MIYNDMRPYRFDDVKGQTLVVENIRNQSKKNRFFPVFILCGQYGSGKTTMARIIAMAANCKHKDANGNPCGECDSCRAVLDHSPEGIIEIDGASNNGVEDVRKLLADAGTFGMFEKKVIVIDEAHMLSKSAFNALLITLENPPEHCIFILCTTEKDALPDTVVSRAPVYTFGKIADDVIKNHIMEVAQKSNIRISEDAAGLLARYANGAMRNALQILEHLSLQKSNREEITDQDVVSILGLSSIDQRAAFLEACLLADVGKIHGILLDGENGGVALNTFLADVLSMATDLLLYNAQSKVVGTTYYMQALDHLSSYGEAAAGKLCGLFSRLTSARNRYLTSEQVVMEVLAAFHAVDETAAQIVYVKAPEKSMKSESVSETGKGKPGEKVTLPDQVPAEPVQEESNRSEAKSDDETVKTEEVGRLEKPAKPAENVSVKPEKPSDDDKGFKDVDLASVPFDTNQEEAPTCNFDAKSLFAGTGAFGFGTIATAGGKPKKRKKNRDQSSMEFDLMAAVSSGKEKVKVQEEPEKNLNPELDLLSEEVLTDAPEASESFSDLIPEEQESSSDLDAGTAEHEPGQPIAQDTEDASTCDDQAEEELTWEQMAEMGLVADEVTIPVPETQEKLDKEYGKAAAKNLSISDVVIPDANEPEEEPSDEPEENPAFRTKEDLMLANKELESMMKKVGFKHLYDRACLKHVNNMVYLVFSERRYAVAAKVMVGSAGKKRIKIIMEGGSEV